MVPMIYFFIQHKVHRIPGGESRDNDVNTRNSCVAVAAYTQYSFFEWGLILFDVMFDSAVEQELEAANLEVRLCATRYYTTFQLLRSRLQWALVLQVQERTTCTHDFIALPNVY